MSANLLTDNIVRLMKRHILIVFLAIVSIISTHAQQVTPALTVYKQFKPATVLLADGKKMKLPLANIFLKNSTLLYKSGLETKQANMKTLLRVDFEERSYLRIDTLLAYQVDTLGRDGLFCAQLIDMESYNQQIENNRNFTSIEVNDMLGYTTVDLQGDLDIHFPVQNVYFFRIKGKYVLAHERSVRQAIGKDKRYKLDAAIAVPGFSWNDEKSLMDLLKMIQ